MVQVWHDAVASAGRAGVDRVTPLDLLVGLLAAGEGVGLRVLRALEADVERMRAGVRCPLVTDSHADDRGRIDGLPVKPAEGSFIEAVRLSPDAEAVVAAGANEPAGYFDTAHLLIGLLQHGIPELVDQGVTVDRARSEIQRHLREFLSGRASPVDPADADELIGTPRVRIPPDIRDLTARIADARRERNERSTRRSSSKPARAAIGNGNSVPTALAASNGGPGR
jgi:hypothetical protein